MTGLERLRRALANKPLDRPPADFWAEEVSKERLFRHLGHRDLERFLDEMRVDIREASALTPEETRLDDRVFQNYWGERYVYRETPYGGMREDLPGALAGARSLRDIRDFPWPVNDDFDYSGLGKRCADIRGKGCAVRYGSADVWQRPLLVRGMENALLDMYENPEWILWLSRKFTDFYLEDYRRAWEASGGRIDIFVVYSDLGTQQGALISTSMFREFVFPFLRELANEVHRFGASLMFHSCGDVSSFIPDIIGAGADILDPIQPVNPNMSPERLSEYAGQICFHGGMDVQKLLPYADAAQIRLAAHRCFKALGPGYILAPTHFYQPDIPPENIMAVYRSFLG